MSCGKMCICPKTTCANYGKCCECVAKHRGTDSLPFCMFPNNGGDKSVTNYNESVKLKR